MIIQQFIMSELQTELVHTIFRLLFMIGFCPVTQGPGAIVVIVLITLVG